MSQTQVWIDLKTRFDVDLGDSILGNQVDSDTFISIKWNIVESATPGHSKVEFRRACDGKLHMPGAPAVVYEDGSKLYYLNGFLHNPNGPARILILNGVKYCEFYCYGILTGTNGVGIGPTPKQLAAIPHLPGEPIADPRDACWQI